MESINISLFEPLKQFVDGQILGFSSARVTQISRPDSAFINKIKAL